ncbi:MAG: hypothetical protein JO033_08360 [Acidobacteriaceae bacterium]|nr:hypothetical protein [Acidobacteriaceae bacterium]
MHQTLTVINVVEDYSADNTGATDTDDQINAALLNVPVGQPPNVAAGALVYFPRGTYKIKKPLIRQVSFTRCVGEGKVATVIKLDAANWQGIISPTDPAGSFIFDLQRPAVTDCAVTDMRIDGSAGSLQETDGTKSANYSGILCSARDEIARVSLYDIWGFGLWIFGQKAANARVLDCEADRGSNPHATTHTGGNDCIGGGSVRSKIARFYWMPTLAKNTALDFTAPGVASGPNAKPTEVSVDILDSINESGHDIVLEGCYQTTIRGNRFYGNDLVIQSDALYANHETIQNPMDILIADNLFEGQQPSQGQPYVGGSCRVAFDGGLYCPGKQLLNNGGRIAILGNSFINSAGGNPTNPASAVEWGGDDASNSDGNSIIAYNRIINPNPNGISGTINRKSGCGSVSFGDLAGSGISVLSSYGLIIGQNTIEDTRSPELMQYAMQLFSSTGLPSGATMGRIFVEENLCGSAPGIGYGKLGAFYMNPNPSDALPLPILRGNMNQDAGYDASASAQLSSSAFNGHPWPGPGGYPYDALIYVSSGTVTELAINLTDTGLKAGSFYLPAGEHITIGWSQQPTIKVFRVAA